MGNTCSHSVHLAPCRSSMLPSFEIKDNEQKGILKYRSSATRLLPPPQPGQCLRITENGNILLNGGTISGRKLPSLIEEEADSEVLRILQKRMSRLDERERNTDHVHRSHSDPDISHSLIEQKNCGEKRHFFKSAAAVSPSKAKIKSRKTNRAPEPPRSDRRQDKSDPYSLRHGTHFKPNRKEWKAKQPAPPPPPPLLSSERGKLETLQEVPGDGDSRSSSDAFRINISENRDISKNINKNLYENTEQSQSKERQERYPTKVEREANVTTDNKFEQMRNVVFNSKNITLETHELRSTSSLVCNKTENRNAGTFKEQIEAAARKHFQRSKEVSKSTEKTKTDQQGRGQHFESKTECCSSRKFYFSENVSSKCKRSEGLILTEAHNPKKSTETRDKNPIVTKAVVSHTFSASDQPEKITKIIEFTKNEISNQLGCLRGHKSTKHTNSEVQQEVLNNSIKAALDRTDTPTLSRYNMVYRSLDNRSDESERTEVKHADYKSHFSDSDENNTDIRLQLKPTLPRKHLEIPKFSPSEAWKCLNIDRIIGHHESDLSSNEEDIHEEKINQRNRSSVPQRSIVDLCDDSKFSQDGEFAHKEEAPPKIDTNQRPEVLGSSSPEMSATDRQTWIPQNDLEDSETGSVNNCGSNQKHKYSSQNMLTQAKLSLPGNMFGGHQSLPILSDVMCDNGVNSSSFNKGKHGKCKKKDKDGMVTSQHFNSLRNIKKAFRFGNKNIIDEAHSRLGPNWSLSRSIPNNIYKIHETENIGLRKSLSGSMFPSSHDEPDRTNVFSKQTQEVQSFLLQDKGPMMYLPKYASSRSFSDPNKECKRNPSTTKGHSKEKKRFAFDSTIRKHERQKIELKLSRQAAMKEKEREKEIELMNKVEDEFRKQRDKEKISIRYQLRILNREENKDDSNLDKQYMIGQFPNKNEEDVFISDSTTGESDEKRSAYTSENSSPQITPQNQPQWTTGMRKWLRRQRQADDSKKEFSPPRPEPEGARSSGDESQQRDECWCQQSTMCQSLAVANNRENSNVYDTLEVRKDVVNKSCTDGEVCNDNSPMEYNFTNWNWNSNFKERPVQFCSRENTTRQTTESVNQEKHKLNTSRINPRHGKDCVFSKQLNNRDDKEYIQHQKSRCALTDWLPESKQYSWSMGLRRKSCDETSDDESSSASDHNKSSKQMKYVKKDCLLNNSSCRHMSDSEPQTCDKQEYNGLNKCDLTLVLVQPVTTEGGADIQDFVRKEIQFP
ncbi:uncharacterized protein LOC143248508 [Tachypleus tridentatus]|uniref:uncharacterized protein LOC143248508 n=1 Tax=Tachypleus tridentatus TaxID=6853 RepID=UPI003FD1DAFB